MSTFPRSNIQNVFYKDSNAIETVSKSLRTHSLLKEDVKFDRSGFSYEYLRKFGRSSIL